MPAMNLKFSALLGITFITGLLAGGFIPKSPEESPASSPPISPVDPPAASAVPAKNVEKASPPPENMDLPLAVKTDFPPEAEAAPAPPDFSPEQQRFLVLGEALATRIRSRAQSRLDDWATTLNLTDAQRWQLLPLLEQYEEGRLSRFLDLQPGDLTLDAAMRAVLDDEQFASYLQETEEEIQQRAERWSEGMTRRVTSELTLEENASAQLQSVLEESLQEMMLYREMGEEYDLGSRVSDRLKGVVSEEEAERIGELLNRRRGRPRG